MLGSCVRRAVDREVVLDQFSGPAHIKGKTTQDQLPCRLRHVPSLHHFLLLQLQKKLIVTCMSRYFKFSEQKRGFLLQRGEGSPTSSEWF